MTFPAIMRRPRFESFIGTLPAARVVRQWRDDSVAKVGDRIFCLLDGDPGEVWFKASEVAFTLLTDLPGIRPAPYFARAQWVAVSPASPLSAAEIEAYLTEAHRLVAARLTRKAKAALGLAEWIKGKRCPHRTFRPFVGREIPHGLMSVGVSPWTLHWSFSQEADEGGAIGNGLMM